MMAALIWGFIIVCLLLMALFLADGLVQWITGYRTLLP